MGPLETLETSSGLPSCLHPFDHEPTDHLAYDDEQIRARADSDRGRQTIRKYKLDRQDLNLGRSRALTTFLRAVIAFEQTGRSAATVELVRSFGQRERPFSAMFAPLVERLLGP